MNLIVRRKKTKSHTERERVRVRVCISLFLRYENEEFLSIKLEKKCIKKSADARSRFRHQTNPLLLVSFAFSKILFSESRFYHSRRWVLLLLRVVPLLWKRTTTTVFFFFCFFFAFPNGGREKEQRGRFGADDGDVKSSFESWK